MSGRKSSHVTLPGRRLSVISSHTTDTGSNTLVMVAAGGIRSVILSAILGMASTAIVNQNRKIDRLTDKSFFRLSKAIV